MLLPVVWLVVPAVVSGRCLASFARNSSSGCTGRTPCCETITRLSGLEIHEPMVICNEEHRFLVAEQLRQLNKLSNNIILEPVGRNTAPAIAHNGPSRPPVTVTTADAGPRRRPYHQ